MALPAIELIAPLASQRRMEISPDASAGSPHHFLTHRVEPGALVITDGWIGHLGITGLCYGHVRGNQRAARARGEDPGELLPRVNRVAGLARRWCQVAPPSVGHRRAARPWRTAHLA
jgi:hypothetical protein